MANVASPSCWPAYSSAAPRDWVGPEGGPTGGPLFSPHRRTGPTVSTPPPPRSSARSPPAAGQGDQRPGPAVLDFGRGFTPAATDRPAQLLHPVPSRIPPVAGIAAQRAKAPPGPPRAEQVRQRQDEGARRARAATRSRFPVMPKQYRTSAPRRADQIEKRPSCCSEKILSLEPDYRSPKGQHSVTPCQAPQGRLAVRPPPHPRRALSLSRRIARRGS